MDNFKEHFSTHYILVKEENEMHALDTLDRAGYKIQGGDVNYKIREIRESEYNILEE